MPMESKTISTLRSAIESSVDNFDNGSVYYVPQDLPVDYFPIRFNPYLRQDAVADTLLDAGTDTLGNPLLTKLLTASVKVFAKDCIKHEWQRRRLADRLNDPVH